MKSSRKRKDEAVGSNRYFPHEKKGSNSYFRNIRKNQTMERLLPLLLGRDWHEENDRTKIG
jgi:hypothetical protein